MENKEHARLVLRKAAGCFWLVDTGQSGRPYIPPLRLNEAAAAIWTSLSEGRSPKEIAAELAGTGEVTAEEAFEDVKGVMELVEKEIMMKRE